MVKSLNTRGKTRMLLNEFNPDQMQDEIISVEEEEISPSSVATTNSSLRDPGTPTYTYKVKFKHYKWKYLTF